MIYIENNTFDSYTGYGRFASYIVKYMDSYPIHSQQFQATKHIKAIQGIYDSIPVLSILSPMYLRPCPNPRILYTMTEGSEVPVKWFSYINNCNIKQIIVPCEWNKKAFEKAFPRIPINVVHGGTEPSEFPLINVDNDIYTFLAFADRGDRKGWVQVWECFWDEFIDKPAKLIIKYRKSGDTTLLNKLADKDYNGKVEFISSDIDNIHDLYKSVNCVVIPSHSEGWGMIMREAACSGLPVITTKYSGMDDGNIEKWAYPIYNYTEVDVPFDENLAGKCALPSMKELRAQMLNMFEDRPSGLGYDWIRNNQTWKHTVRNLEQVLYV